MSKIPASHYNDQGQRERWPVLIYRLQSHRGWEVYYHPDMEKKQGKNAKAEELTAAPRENCIEVKTMRMRIWLFEQHKTKEMRGDATISGTQDDGTAVAERGENDKNTDGWKNNALVVRRLNTLLVTTRRGTYAIVFKFKCNQDCIEFCDRLVYLNRNHFNNALETSGDNYVLNGMDSRDTHCDDLREVKRRRLSISRDQHFMNTGESRRGENGTEHDKAADVKQSHRQDELLSYIVRLAHDEDFLGFVDEIERGLQSAPETAAMGFCDMTPDKE